MTTNENARYKINTETNENDFAKRKKITKMIGSLAEPPAIWSGRWRFSAGQIQNSPAMAGGPAHFADTDSGSLMLTDSPKKEK